MSRANFGYLIALCTTIILVIFTGCNPNPPDDPDKPGTEGKITYTLADGVSLVDSTTLDHIAKWQPDSSYIQDGVCYFGHLFYDKSTPKKDLPTGKIIINKPTEQLPEGLIAVIDEMTETGEGYDLHYRSLELRQAIKNLEIEERSISLNDHLQKVVDRKGRTLQQKIKKAAGKENCHVEISGNDWDLPFGISMTPKMVADIVLKMQMSMSDYSISTLNFVVESDISFNSEFTIDIASAELSKDYLICSMFFAAIPVGPLVITPSIDVYATLSIEGKVCLSAELSYTQGFRAELHYDEINGLSGECKEKEVSEPFKAQFGTKLGGAIKYGLAIGPTIGIYGQTLQAGLTLNANISEEAEIFQSVSDDVKVIDVAEYLNNAELLDFNPEGFEWHTWVTTPLTLKTNLEIGAGLHFGGLGIYEKKFNTPTIAIELDKRIPYGPNPNISNGITYTLNGNQLELNMAVNRTALFYPSAIKLYLNKKKSYAQYEFVHVADFEFGEAQIEQLESGADSIQITATATLDPGEYRNAYVTYVYNGREYYRGQFIKDFISTDSKTEEVARKLLAALYENRDGEWEGCKWNDPSVPLADMIKGDKFGYSFISKDAIYIHLPSNWKLKSDISIGDITGSLADTDFYWALTAISEGTWEGKGDNLPEYNSLEIKDPCCKYFYVGPNVKKFVCKSKKYEMRTGSNDQYAVPRNAETLDLSETGFATFLGGDFDNKTNEFPNLKSIKMDKCSNLKSVKLISRIDNIELSFKDCPKLEDFKIRLTKGVSSGAFDDVAVTAGNGIVTIDSVQGQTINWTGECKKLTITSSTLNDLNIAGRTHLTNLIVRETAHMTNLNISNCNALKTIDANYGDKQNISVSNCPSLLVLDCYLANVASLNVTNCPAMTDIDCTSNMSLGGIMLPIFDQIYNMGNKPLYDQRYTYYSDGSVMKDLGYGFYYEGEPQRGYHRE